MEPTKEQLRLIAQGREARGILESTVARELRDEQLGEIAKEIEALDPLNREWFTVLQARRQGVLAFWQLLESAKLEGAHEEMVIAGEYEEPAERT